MNRITLITHSFGCALLIAGSAAAADTPNATDIVQAAVDNWRGSSSYGEMSMTIHRPSWERTMVMRGWTSGSKRSLVRVTAPKKDAGNATLTVDDNMWTYSPKINRVIKVPSSMMAQSWMGSDFSNKDVSRTDDIIEQYDHSLVATETADGHTVWTVESIPHEDAAVVWGKQVLEIRDDHVLLSEAFYDQDGALVKSLKTLDIEKMGGRMVAARQRMSKADTPDEWTELEVTSIEFDTDIPDNVFTRSNLQNPRN
ncbi:MAG: outer membrane lipoprotein-sorting protein [Holophagae bacterium]|jgi:outer membrane lipoprotein-sorting protein